MTEKKELSSKDKILNTARQLIKENGYDNLNVNHLADKAGVAIGTLYWHYKKGKHSIIKELASREVNQLKQFLKDIKIESSESLEAFIPFLLKYMEFHRKNKEILRAFEIEILQKQEIYNESDTILKTEFEESYKIIESILKGIHFKTKNLSEKLRFITLFLDDLVHKQVLFDNRYGTDEELAQFLIKTFKIFLK